MQDDYTTLEDLVRTQYANVFWTHKIQEKQAEIYESRHKLFSWINIISASLTSAGIISIVFVIQYTFSTPRLKNVLYLCKEKKL